MYPLYAGCRALSLAALMLVLYLDPKLGASVWNTAACIAQSPLRAEELCLLVSDECVIVVCGILIASGQKPVFHLYRVLQFAPGTLLVPRSNASSHLDTAMQFDQHSIYMEQHMAPPAHGLPYMSNDSILLQHYAEMAPMGDTRNALQGDGHMHASTGFDIDQGSGGMAFMYT